jgi:signal transduction histidine kinase
MAAVHPEDLEHLQDFVSRTLQQQATAQSCEYRKRRFDGAYLWYSAQVSKIIGAQGAEDFFLFSSTDIHDRKMAEDRAGITQKLESIGRLTGGMAHDFNNLLAIIIGNLDLVKLEPNAPFTARKLDDAINAAQRGVGLVKSLLALASRQPLTPVQIDLGQLIERIAPLLRNALARHNAASAVRCSILNTARLTSRKANWRSAYAPQPLPHTSSNTSYETPLCSVSSAACQHQTRAKLSSQPSKAGKWWGTRAIPRWLPW